MAESIPTLESIPTFEVCGGISCHGLQSWWPAIDARVWGYGSETCLTLQHCTGFEADITQEFWLNSRTIEIYIYIYLFWNHMWEFGANTLKKENKNMHLQMRATSLVAYLCKKNLAKEPTLKSTYSHSNTIGSTVPPLRLWFICWWTSSCDLGLYNSKIGVLISPGGKFHRARFLPKLLPHDV